MLRIASNRRGSGHVNGQSGTCARATEVHRHQKQLECTQKPCTGACLLAWVFVCKRCVCTWAAHHACMQAPAGQGLHAAALI